jgi:osmotically-inducible protein OsmY
VPGHDESTVIGAKRYVEEKPSESSAGRSVKSMIGSCVTSIAAAVLAAAYAANPPNSPKQTQSDIQATKEFYSKLNSDTDYYYPHVTIRVKNGVAHLRGYAWNTQALYRAKEIAASVPGVVSVVDNLELQRDGERRGMRERQSA